MKRLLQTAMVAGAMMIGAFAQAGSIENFSNCLVEKTSAEDRLNLIHWMYLGMSAHPSLNHLSTVTEKDGIEVNQKVAEFYNRLFVKDCVNEFKVVYREHQNGGIQAAFSVLGEVAMAELMQNPNVTNDLMLFTEYLDVAAFEKLLQ